MQKAINFVLFVFTVNKAIATIISIHGLQALPTFNGAH